MTEDFDDDADKNNDVDDDDLGIPGDIPGDAGGDHDWSRWPFTDVGSPFDEAGFPFNDHHEGEDEVRWFITPSPPMMLWIPLWAPPLNHAITQIFFAFTHSRNERKIWVLTQYRKNWVRKKGQSCNHADVWGVGPWISIFRILRIYIRSPVHKC